MAKKTHSEMIGMASFIVASQKRVTANSQKLLKYLGDLSADLKSKRERIRNLEAKNRSLRAKLEKKERNVRLYAFKKLDMPRKKLFCLNIEQLLPPLKALDRKGRNCRGRLIDRLKTVKDPTQRGLCADLSEVGKIVDALGHGNGEWKSLGIRADLGPKPLNMLRIAFMNRGICEPDGTIITRS